MSDKKRAIIAATIGAAILLLKFYQKEKPVVIVAGGENDSGGSVAPFVAPYLSTNPGIPDVSSILNGGNTFNSAVNIALNPSVGMQLNRQYIPMFGFVGVQTIGVPGETKNIYYDNQSAKTAYDVQFGNVMKTPQGWASVNPMTGKPYGFLSPSFNPQSGYG